MANLNLYVDDGDVDRIVAAFEFKYGLKQPGETNGQYIKKHIEALVDRWVKESTSQKALNLSNLNHVPIDFTEE